MSSISTSDNGSFQAILESKSQFRENVPNNLSPIPPFREALFSSSLKHKPTLKLDEIFQSPKIEDLLIATGQEILSHEHAFKLCNETPFPPIIAWIEHYQTSASAFRKLQALNAIEARLRRLDVLLPPDVLRHGVRLAVRAAWPEAVKTYLDLLEVPSHGRSTMQPGNFNGLMREISKITKTQDFRGWKGQRSKLRWIAVITGLEVDRLYEPYGHRGACIFKLLPSYDVKAWLSYLNLVRDLGNADLIYCEWMNFKQTEQFSPAVAPSKDADEDRTMGSISHSADEEEGTAGGNGLTRIEAISHSPDGSLDKLEGSKLKQEADNRVVGNAFIQALAHHGDHERAWRIAYDLAYSYGGISDESWSLLLAEPRYLNDWIPELNRVVLRELKSSLMAIEAALGIRWTGGDSGFHDVLNRAPGGQEAGRIAKTLNAKQEAQEA